MWNSKISLRTKGLYDDIKFNSISFEEVKAEMDLK